jgi:hypothetical protein
VSLEVGDLAGKFGVQVFQFLEAGAEQSGFGRSGHGATVASSLAGVDQKFLVLAQSSCLARGASRLGPAAPPIWGMRLDLPVARSPLPQHDPAHPGDC